MCNYHPPGNVRASHHSLSIMDHRPPTLPTFLAVYGLLYVAFGAQSPFLPALLREQGLRPEEIGIVLGASTAIRVFAGPAVGHIADRLRRHTLTLCVRALAAAVAGLGYVMLQSFAGLLLVALVHAAMLAPIVPLSDALATTAARRSETGEGRRFEYGWLRAAGSAAFIVGTMLSGWAASGNGLASIVWFSGTLLGIGGGAALLLPKISAAPVLSNTYRALDNAGLGLPPENTCFPSLAHNRRPDRGQPRSARFVFGNSLACSRSRIAGYQCPLVRVRVVGGCGLPIDRAAIGSPACSRWGNDPGCGSRGHPLDCCGVHHVASHLGIRSASAWVHIRTAALGSHAGDSAGDTASFDCNGASHLRHAVHRVGYSRTDPGFRPALWLDGRIRVSRHGRALSAGAANVRSIAPILRKLTAMVTSVAVPLRQPPSHASSVENCAPYTDLHCHRRRPAPGRWHP